MDNSLVSPQLLQQCLGEQLETLDLLFLTSEPADQVLESLQSAYPSCVGQPVVLQVADVADFEGLGGARWPLVCLLEPDLDKKSLIRLLARLRDLHADRVIHITPGANGSTPAESGRPADQDWSLSDSLALGFSYRGPIKAGSRKLLAFEFDIRTYKPAPDWLNSKHWANPEQWGKHRW